MNSLIIDKARALQEVDADYSTTTELADVLQRDSNVPFRVGHHFASDLVTYGRLNKMKPADIPFPEVQRIYGEALKAFNFDHATFPLTQVQFRTSLTAQNMIESSKGLGGPQHAEVTRMLDEEKTRLTQDQQWVDQQRQKLATASADLDKAFHNAGR